MPDFGFIGASYVAASIYQNDQECINLYPENDPTKTDANPMTQDQRGVLALYPTPGLKRKTTLAAAAEVRAVYPLPGNTQMLAVCGTSLSILDTAFNETVVGTLNSRLGPVSISDNGVSAYLCDGLDRYYYTWGTNTFAVVTDGPFNGGTRTDIVDNYLLYNRPGTQQWGCTNAGSIISSGLNVASADAAPDKLITLIVVNRDVFLLGEVTTEPWQDVGAFPFPFQRIPGTLMQHGTLAPFSVARLGEGFAWLANDTRGTSTVAMISGYSPKRISHFGVEQAIQSYAVTNDAIAYSYAQSGHEFYVLTFPTADVTWVYDLATQLWHKRAWRDSANVLHRHRTNCACNFNGDIVVGDWENGKLYTLDQSDYTDDGDVIPCVRRAPHLTTDLNRQFFDNLQIQFQPGVGLQSGQGSDPQAMLKWSDDGGSTWSKPHWAPIGRAGKYKNRARWRRLGSARDRIFEVTVTDPVYRVMVSANLNATAGAN
jgi:hypothetical protein